MDMPNGAPAADNVPSSRLAAAFRICCWLASGALLALVATCYWQRFDACTFVTLFPPWCWVAGGLFLAAFSFSRPRWQASLGLALVWLMFLAASADTPMSLVRGCLPHSDVGHDLRVITINCAGRGAAIRSVLDLKPDIVLVQESIGRGGFVPIARQMYGANTVAVESNDASILARGEVTPVPVPPEIAHVAVHARIEQAGRTLNVMSFHLCPCPIRLDLWSPDCWRYYRTNRENRRRQLATIADYAKSLPADEPLILGGDFNCPPRDAVLELLRPWLTDAFATAGRGWGATIIEFSGVPMIRIDQIWTNSELRAVDAFARRAFGSDHHMTVADFVFRARQD